MTSSDSAADAADALTAKAGTPIYVTRSRPALRIVVAYRYTAMPTQIGDGGRLHASESGDRA